MDFNGFNNFQDFMNAYSSNNASPGDPEGEKDIPGGFQDLDPMAFATIGEIIGNIMAGNMPFNVQNAIANWLMLVGQAIVTFNAQQQYFQSGPGRYYNRANKNVTNPFDSSNTPQGSAFSDGTTTSSSNESIDDLKKYICNLTKEIDSLKIEVEYLKKKISK